MVEVQPSIDYTSTEILMPFFFLQIKWESFHRNAYKCTRIFLYFFENLTGERILQAYIHFLGLDFWKNGFVSWSRTWDTNVFQHFSHCHATHKNHNSVTLRLTVVFFLLNDEYFFHDKNTAKCGGIIGKELNWQTEGEEDDRIKILSVSLKFQYIRIYGNGM